MRLPLPHTRAGKTAGQERNGKNFSTIPSKFETTLFTGNKEKDGFGSSAHRFVDMENDLPGPGTYNEGAAGVRDDRVYSKKGLGVGFVSRTKRDGAFKGAATAPGPGNYERGGSLVDAVRATNRGNRSGTTATFKPPTQRSVMVAREEMPGPADYRVHRNFDPGAPQPANQAMEASVFRSATTRGPPPGSKHRITPAPGQYNPTVPGSQSAEAIPMAAFRSGVPNAGASAQPRMTREQQLGVVAYTAPPKPGPGEYEVKTSALPAPSGRRMPQFFDSNHDRFGKLVGAPPDMQPGPGAYIRDAEPATAIISGSVFMSGTRRDGRGGRDAVPGPAYYSPAAGSTAGSRKSYHLNARQRWMPN